MLLPGTKRMHSYSFIHSLSLPTYKNDLRLFVTLWRATYKATCPSYKFAAQELLHIGHTSLTRTWNEKQHSQPSGNPETSFPVTPPHYLDWPLSPLAIILTSNVESSCMCFLIHGFFLVTILFTFYIGVVHLFSLLYSIPLYGCTIVYLFILLLMGVWITSFLSYSE